MHVKDKLIAVRVIASLGILMALVLPYFGLFPHSSSVTIILATLVVFFGVEHHFS